MRAIVGCLLFFVAVCVAGCAEEAQFDDPNLEAAIREAIGKPEDAISDIDPLANLTNLTTLKLSRNMISDIKPLVENKGLSEDDKVDLEGNPLNDAAHGVHIPALEKRGVKVNFTPKP